MSKTVCLFHRADFDGIFCREIARKFLPADTEFIGWDYGDAPVADEKLRLTETIYILDLSPDCIDERTQCRPNQLIWIDHHKSAIDKFPTAIHGYRIDGVAACRLVYQYFTCETGPHNPHCHPADYRLPEKQQYVDRTVSEPLAVRLAGEYDIWDKRDPDAELFQHGLRSQNLDSLWEILLSGPTQPKNQQIGMAEATVLALLDAGNAIQYAKTQENESIIKAAGFTIQFEGLTFLACNHARYNSFLFTAGLKPEHDACFGFAWRDGHWNVSLYHAPSKEHHDLSLIAVKHGGGGHKGACGFRVKTLPFHYEPLPFIRGQQVTRQEIIDGLESNYKDTLTVEREKHPGTTGFPDMEAILEFIDEHGLPPKA